MNRFEHNNERSARLFCRMGWSQPEIAALAISLTTWFYAIPAVTAAVKLPAVFSDNMVLQRYCPIKIWGTADPGEKVTVQLAGYKTTTAAASSGDWQVLLPAVGAGGPYELIVTAGNTIRLRNVVAGDIWLCAGQSNMALTVASAAGAEQTIASAGNSSVRLFTVAPQIASKPMTDTSGIWSLSTPAAIAAFSATGYFFALELNKELHVPVGLIDCTFGGSPVDAWVSRRGLDPVSGYRATLNKWDQTLDSYPQLKRVYAEQLIAWREGRGFWKMLHLRPPAPPVPPPPLNMMGRPTSLFNGMVAPILRLPIKGVIWCQGEADVGQSGKYSTLFPALIADWRQQRRQNDLPFYFIQLHNYQSQSKQPQRSRLAEMRQAQASALALPHTGMAVAIDLGGKGDNIHYKDKKSAGHRLALLVLSGEYGRHLPASGPTFCSATMERERIRLKFNHCQGLAARNGLPLKGFAIAGADRRFVWADARIEGNNVVVTARDVDRPQAVRYAWADNPDCNLINGAGLPAAPFRTDNWDH